MTEQVRDRVRFNDHTYSLVGSVGGDLVTPGLFDMLAVHLSTACTRGYHIDYEIDGQSRLCLRKLTLRAYNDEYKPVDGIEPELSMGGAVYANLNVLVPFTGKLRIGTDRVDESQRSRRAPACMAFRTVLDLALRNGRLVASMDRSSEVNGKRDWVLSRYRPSSEPDGVYDDLALIADPGY